MRIFTLFILLALPFISFTQEDEAPYLKNPVIPSFSILKEDSTSWFSSRDIRNGMSVIIMLFSPECDHCREQTAILTKNMDKLKNAEIIMSTFQPIYKMKEFSNQYKLTSYPNIHLGRDVKYFFGPFYRIRYSPFIAVYNKERKLVKVFEGGANIEKLLDAINN
jgi:thiol-disulfide isomerase/thioredoxin